MTTLPKAIYRLNAIPIKITTAFITEMETSIFKSVWNCKKPQIATTILERKNKVGGLPLPYFRTLYKASVIKTA